MCYERNLEKQTESCAWERAQEPPREASNYPFALVTVVTASLRGMRNLCPASGLWPGGSKSTQEVRAVALPGAGQRHRVRKRVPARAEPLFSWLTGHRRNRASLRRPRHTRDLPCFRIRWY